MTDDGHRSAFVPPDGGPDGSVDIWFAPTAPTGKEKNWIKTLPGEGWSILVQLYGPLEPWFDDEWRPDDIVKVGSEKCGDSIRIT